MNFGNDSSPPEIGLTVENIGGVEQRCQQFVPGVTLLTGRNATNRTSVLQAISTVLGTSIGSVRTGTDRGRVELTIGAESYSRSVSRVDNGTVSSGDPYIEDFDTIQCVELFATLGRDNPIRTAMRNDSDELRDLLLQPVDEDDIRFRRKRIREEIADLEETYERLVETAEELPSLKTRKAELQTKRDELAAQVKDLEASIENAEQDVNTAGEPREELVELQAELEEVHDELTTAQATRTNEQSTLEELHSQRDELQAALEELDTPDDSVPALRERQAEIINELNEVRTERDQLEDLIETNRDRLVAQQASNQAAESIDHGDQQVEHPVGDHSRTVTCWTCGQSADVGRIQETIQQLQQDADELSEQRESLEDEQAELESRIAQSRESRGEREDFQARLETVEERINETQRAIDGLESRIDDRKKRAEDITSRLQELDRNSHAETLSELYDHLIEAREQEARVEERLASVREDIELAREAVTEREEIEQELDQKRDQQRFLRHRIRDLETAVVETFNDHIETVIEELAYSGLERVWLERQAPDAKQSNPSRNNSSTAEFVVHVVRTDDDGTAHRDSLRNLSDSEREVIGLILALAGYLAHDVHDDVPIVVLDGVEAIDADRLAGLVSHFADHAEYVITAVLEADATAGPLRDQADAVEQFSTSADGPD